MTKAERVAKVTVDCLIARHDCDEQYFPEDDDYALVSILCESCKAKIRAIEEEA